MLDGTRLTRAERLAERRRRRADARHADAGEAEPSSEYSGSFEPIRKPVAVNAADGTTPASVDVHRPEDRSTAKTPRRSLCGRIAAGFRQTRGRAGTIRRFTTAAARGTSSSATGRTSAAVDRAR
ncbi:MAG: hypothetical protein R3C19_07085 [Planctomycetaceae bacterium]